MSSYNGDLILLRGVVGSGKSTLADIIEPVNNTCADRWFDLYNEGVFDHTKLKFAHDWCKHITESCMSRGAIKVVVHNTFTQYWEMEDYFKIAEKYNYRVHTIIVENRHESESVHNVPDETKKKMIKRFEVVL
jgi:predicted kinase